MLGRRSDKNRGDQGCGHGEKRSSDHEVKYGSPAAGEGYH